jgi:hypothetical protein
MVCLRRLCDLGNAGQKPKFPKINIRRDLNHATVQFLCGLVCFALTRTETVHLSTCAYQARLFSTGKRG